MTKIRDRVFLISADLRSLMFTITAEKQITTVSTTATIISTTTAISTATAVNSKP